MTGFVSGFVPGTVRSTTPVAEGVRELEIVPADGAGAFAAGSHLDLALSVDGLPVTRSYSVVGATPIDGAYRIAVRLLPDSRGGSRWVHALRPGDPVELRHPSTHFELGPGRPEYLLVAGGIGVTPLIGMAARLVARGATVRLVYAGRTSASMPYVPALRELLGDGLEVVLGERGERLDLAAAFAALHADAEAYVCGPPSLSDAARTAWREAGRSTPRLRFETFGSGGRHPTAAFDVEVRDRGRTVHVPRDRTLLAALQDAGVDMIWDCLRGECGLCTVTVLGGDTIDHRDVFYSEQEQVESTRMCACVSRAVGGRIAVDTGYR